MKLSNNNIIKIQEVECQDQIKLVQSSESQYEMNNGMLYRMNKPYLPPSLIPIALAYGHLIIGLGGRLKLYNWIKNFYYINSLKKWVIRFVQSCYVCRVTYYSTNRYGEFGTLPMGNYPMELIFMDMVEKLPTSREQYKYALVIVDAYSRYLAAFPVKSNNTNINECNSFTLSCDRYNLYIRITRSSLINKNTTYLVWIQMDTNEIMVLYFACRIIA